MTSGPAVLTADGVIGVSGKPVRIYSVVMLSGSGGAGELVLRNGTSASGTIYVKEDGSAASHTDTYNFAGGLTFQGGCFFDKDTNTDQIVVSFEQVQA